MVFLSLGSSDSQSILMQKVALNLKLFSFYYVTNKEIKNKVNINTIWNWEDDATTTDTAPSAALYGTM